MQAITLQYVLLVQGRRKFWSLVS